MTLLMTLAGWVVMCVGRRRRRLDGEAAVRRTSSEDNWSKIDALPLPWKGSSSVAHVAASSGIEANIRLRFGRVILMASRRLTSLISGVGAAAERATRASIVTR